MNLQPGDLVCLRASRDCVWVRRFSLAQQRLRTFGVAAGQVLPVPREFRP